MQCLQKNWFQVRNRNCKQLLVFLVLGFHILNSLSNFGFQDPAAHMVKLFQWSGWRLQLRCMLKHWKSLDIQHRHFSTLNMETSSSLELFILSHSWVTTDYRQGLNWEMNLLDTYTTHDHTLHITVTHRPAFSVMLLGSDFQQQTVLCFWAHILAGWRPFHINLMLGLLASASTSFSC